MPSRVEAHLVDAIAVGIVRLKLWRIRVSVEAEGDDRGLAGKLADALQLARRRAGRVRGERLDQRAVVVEEISAEQRRRLVRDLVRRHRFRPFAA